MASTPRSPVLGVSSPRDPSQRGDHFAADGLVMARRGKDGLYRAELTYNQYVTVSGEIQKVGEVVLRAAERKWGLPQGNLTWKDISFDPMTLTVRSVKDDRGRIDLKTETASKTAFADFSRAVASVWSSASSVKAEESSERQGLGGIAWQGSLALEHASDVGGFVASNEMKSLMTYVQAQGVSPRDALDRIAHTEAMIDGLSRGVRTKIIDLERKLDTLNREIEEAASEHDLEYRKALKAKDPVAGNVAKQKIANTPDLSKKIQERKERLETLDRLYSLEHDVHKMNRDACYWAVGLGIGAKDSQEEKIKKAQGLTKAVQEHVDFMQKDVPEATRMQYANQVGDLLLGDRADYIERTVQEHRKPKQGSLELFIVQMALRKGEASAKIATKWIPDQLRDVVDLCHEEVCEAHLQTTIKIKGAETELSSKTEWTDIHKIMEDKGILPKSSRGARAKRLGRRVLDRMPSPSMVGARSAKRSVKSALPYFGVLPSALWRKSTAQEIADTYGAVIGSSPSSTPEKANWGVDETRTVKAKQKKLQDLILEQKAQQQSVNEAFDALKREMEEIRKERPALKGDAYEKRNTAIELQRNVDLRAQQAETLIEELSKKTEALLELQSKVGTAAQGVIDLGGATGGVRSGAVTYESNGMAKEIQQARKDVALLRISAEIEVVSARDDAAVEALAGNDQEKVQEIQGFLQSQVEQFQRDLETSQSLKAVVSKDLETAFQKTQERIRKMDALIGKRIARDKRQAVVKTHADALARKTVAMMGIGQTALPIDVSKARDQAILDQKNMDTSTSLISKEAAQIGNPQKILQRFQREVTGIERELNVSSAESDLVEKSIKRNQEIMDKLGPVLAINQERIVRRRLGAEEAQSAQDREMLVKALIHGDEKTGLETASALRSQVTKLRRELKEFASFQVLNKETKRSIEEELKKQGAFLEPRRALLNEKTRWKKDVAKVEEGFLSLQTNMYSVQRKLVVALEKPTLEKQRDWAIATQKEVDAITLKMSSVVTLLRGQQSRLENTLAIIRSNEDELGVREENLGDLHAKNGQRLKAAEEGVAALREGIFTIRMNAEQRFFEKNRQILRENVERVLKFTPGEGTFPMDAFMNAQTAAQAIKDQRLQLVREMKASASFDANNEKIQGKLAAFEAAAKTEEQNVADLVSSVPAKLAEHEQLLQREAVYIKRNKAWEEVEKLLSAMLEKNVVLHNLCHALQPSKEDIQKVAEELKSFDEKFTTLVQCQQDWKRFDRPDDKNREIDSTIKQCEFIRKDRLKAIQNVK